MRFREMAIPDAFRIEPEHHRDERGGLHEAYRDDALREVLGRPFVIRQVNYSVSVRGTLRGLHATVTPPGEAKLVTCVRGAILDVALDVRRGSPAFGVFEVTRMDEASGTSVYLGEGLAHGFLALTDEARVSYLCSTEYAPGRMIDVQALDPELGIPWGLTGPPLRSAKDAAAPTLGQVAAAGRLPDYRTCRALHERVPRET
ncbi:dTDP-4-dehydrorhamnose 3,5-epimerase family protein [Actinomadura opuntiae]|uniref:dTDP-4-dehydrorhamnose 3,5-epimerase family protein n=1 Tax=Actinomadura sp. OS1-43 TaxID=604315 RepID=UPI00255B3A19|nr:dTDP-4-dehydrorhamnose 3,5-epimerase [Actinomadura sp. OS1-43]MDL4815425.1 dTDP-4-dehydrorhamnose 3,5-epimerase [Actinomadura sp. OS1-43]